MAEKTIFSCDICSVEYPFKEQSEHCAKQDELKLGLVQHAQQLFVSRAKNLLHNLSYTLSVFQKNWNFKSNPIKLSTHPHKIKLKFEDDWDKTKENLELSLEIITWSVIFQVLINNSIVMEEEDGSNSYLADRFYLESILLSFNQIFSKDSNLKKINPRLVDYYFKLQTYVDTQAINNVEVNNEGNLTITLSHYVIPHYAKDQSKQLELSYETLTNKLFINYSLPVPNYLTEVELEEMFKNCIDFPVITKFKNKEFFLLKHIKAFDFSEILDFFMIVSQINFYLNKIGTKKEDILHNLPILVQVDKGDQTDED